MQESFLAWVALKLRKGSPSNQLQEGLPGKLEHLFLEKSSMFDHDLTTFLKSSFNQKGKFCSLQRLGFLVKGATSGTFPILYPKGLP